MGGNNNFIRLMFMYCEHYLVLKDANKSVSFKYAESHKFPPGYSIKERAEAVSQIMRQKNDDVVTGQVEGKTN